MYYANQDKIVPVYDIYVDAEENEYHLETGETKLVYGDPVEFRGNIAMSVGEAEAVEFGLNLADYEAILVVASNSLPITETSLIWLNTEPKYDNENVVDAHTADYRIVKINKTPNVDKYVLKKVVK
ncbi:MAG: hypothetical protein J6Q48_10570 [Bacteroidaceae bacterium]|nr:hypothetical protein [Bacteroidaceae bacterium]